MNALPSPQRPERRGAPAPLLVSAALLLWPAVWNGYPLVFSDTGTYLTQAIEHHLGWDRPPVYSLAIFPLHMTRTTWPVVAAQALLAAMLLRVLDRILLPAATAWRTARHCVVLAAASAAPWFASQLMPDLLTPLLVLALAPLLLVPARLSARQRWTLAGLAAFMIAAHQSNLPLALILVAVLAPLRHHLGATGRLGPCHRRLLAAPPLLACAALVALNLAGHGRLALSPYGNVFLLARVIEDGPGRQALQRFCPDAGWRLCPWRDALPDNADDFLWRTDSPLVLAGGARAVSAEADAIIAAALQVAPGATLRAALRNFVRQLGAFATGDGLTPWPETVSPAIARDFPAGEAAAYAAARQTAGAPLVPPALTALHALAAVAGVLGCGAAVLLGWRRHVASGFAAAALLAVLANAAITGCLSGPHDRYQSRIMWLPLAVALPALPAVRARRSMIAATAAMARHAADLSRVARGTG